MLKDRVQIAMIRKTWKGQSTTELANIKNTIIFFICPSKIILHKHCFQFFLGSYVLREKIKTMLMQNFGGANKEYYGIFDIG